MKKRILSLTLVLCMVLPMIPFSAISLSAAAVDGLYYDSVYARDVVFGDVPVTSYYTGQAGSLYEENFNSKMMNVNTKYKTYMEFFDAMADFNNTMPDIVIDAGNVHTTGYDAEKWYNDIPADLLSEMNATTAGGYVTRELLGKACKDISTIYNWVDPEKNTPGVDLADRPTEYVYAYTFDPTKEEGYVGPDNLPKMIIAAGNQSDEKGSIYGTYYLLYDILHNWQNNPVLDYLRHHVKLVIVPCLSPGGFNQLSYWNANFVNINRNFESDGKSYIPRLTGGYSYKEQAGGDWVVAELNASGNPLSYKQVEAGTGTHVQYLAPGSYYNKDGSDARDSRYQNAGYHAFDQSEACVLRDLFNANLDAFYYGDFHTNTSGPLKEGDWINVNWLAYGEIPEEAYYKKLLHLADWHINRFSKNTIKNYNLTQFGVGENQKLSNYTTGKAGYTSKDFGKSCNILSTTLEGISGFPGGVLGGRYSPMTQKVDSEILGNWLIALLGEYAYDGNLPTEAYTTSFIPFNENYPVIENLPLTDKGYDRTELEQPTGGFKALADYKDENGNEKYPLVWNGNWMVGSKKINGDGSFNNDPANFTPYKVYVQGDKNKELFLAGDTTVWSTSAYMQLSRATYGAQMASSTSATAYGAEGNKVWGNDATIRYTAEYDGTITINVSDIVFNSNMAQLVIMKNGTRIGGVLPTNTNAQYVADGNGNWTNGSTKNPGATTVSVSVKKGDVIDFVNHNTNDIPGAHQLTVGNMSDMCTPAGSKQYETIRRGIKKFSIAISYYEYAAQDFEDSYVGTKDAVWDGFPYANTIDAFLVWSKTGSLAGATATINPELFKKGWVEEDDTWAEAIDGYLDYLRSLPKHQTKTGWYPVSYEKAGDPTTLGTVAVPINRYSLFGSGQWSNILGVNTDGNYAKGFVAKGDGEQFVVSEAYYEAQLAAFATAGRLLTVGGKAKDIVLSYDNDVLPQKSGFKYVGGPNTGKGINSAVTFLNYGSETNYGSGTYRGTLFRMHGQYKEGGMVYEMPARVSGGYATLTLDDLFTPATHASNEGSFSVYLNGEAIVKETATTGAKMKADLSSALAALGAFKVNAGDILEVRFKRTGGNAIFVAPALTLKVEHMKNTYEGETWLGTKDGITKTSLSFKTLFQWYTPAGEEGRADDTLVASGGALADNSYVVINPYFTDPNATHDYKITADMTYAEAVAVYKKFLMAVSDITSKTNWQIGGMMTKGDPYSSSGSYFSPIRRLAFMPTMSIYAVQLKEVSGTEYTYAGKYKAGTGGEVWVTDEYFEELVNIYCCDYTWSKINGTWTKVTENVNVIPYDTVIGDFNETTLTYKRLVDTHALLDGTGVTAGTNGGTVHAWVPNGAERSTILRTSNNDAEIYKGLMFRPSTGGVIAMGYTVPKEAKGKLVLRLNSLTYGSNGSATQYNGAFQWKVKIDGVDQTSWITYTPTSTTVDTGDALAAINLQLAALPLAVKEGQMIQFCIKNSGATIYVSPSISVSSATDEDLWAGNYGAENKKPSSYQTFFVWYDANGNLIPSYKSNDTNPSLLTGEGTYAVVNPWLIQNGYVKTTDTYKEALQGYKTYLRTVTATAVKNGWQLSGMQSKDNVYSYGEKIVPLCYADFLGLNNIFGIRIAETPVGSSYEYSYDAHYTNSTGRSFDVWVTAPYFEMQMELLCDEIVYNKTTKQFEEVTAPVIPWNTLISTMDTVGTDTHLTYSYITTTATTPTEGSSYAVNNHVSYAWNANGGVWPCVSPSMAAENESKTVYKGMMLRPQSGKGAAVTYTVPEDKEGYAHLRLNGFAFGDWGSSKNLYNGTFSWAIAINDTVVTEWYTASEVNDILYEDASHARVAAINEKLAELSLAVKAGDRVSFCIKNTGTTIYVSPSIAISIEEASHELTPEAMHRITVVSGGKTLTSFLVKNGTNLIDVLNTARVKSEIAGDYAEYGCYVNGKWYNVASLPPITSDTVIDDVKIEVSANLTIGSTYALNVFLPNYNGATAAGVKVYGENIEATPVTDGFLVTVLDGIYTKNLLDTAIYYTPYYVVDGKEVIGGESLTLRARDLLNTYITDPAYAAEKEVAQAAYDYATVAKAYFAGETADAAILARLAAYDAEITGKTPNKLNKTGDEYTFALASLELGDTINFVFAIAKKDGSALTSFDGSLTINGKNVSTSEFLPTSVSGQKMLVAVVEGVPESQFAEKMTFALKGANGETLATVDYSVQDYCVRTLASAVGTPEADIIRAVYAIGKAASEYSK